MKNFILLILSITISSCSSLSNEERMEEINIALNYENFGDTYLKALNTSFLGG